MRQKSWLVLCLIVTLVSMFHAQPARAQQQEESWVGEDKAKHFTLSVGLTGAGYAGGQLIFKDDWIALGFGAGLSLSLGAMKEIFDAMPNGRGGTMGHASYKDFAADVAGTATGVAVCMGVTYIIRKVQKNDKLAFGTF